MHGESIMYCIVLYCVGCPASLLGVRNGRTTKRFWCISLVVHC